MESLSRGLSRRSFARFLGTGLATAALAPAVSEALEAKGARPVRAALHAVPAPAPAEELVRISANENPYGPSPAAFAAIQGSFDRACRYPDEEVEALRAELAKAHGVGVDQVVLGAGSSEILKLAAAAATGPGRKAVVADPTFESILRYAQAAGGESVKVPLTADYRHDLARMAAVPETGLIYVCNPNNPTASLTPKAEVRAFLAALPATTMVLVDEAYFHYVDSPDYETVVPLVARYPNLVVARTFSKIHGMAGLRCGYAVAQKETIERLQLHQAFDSLSVMALVAARASLGDPAHLARSRRLNHEVRAHVVSTVEAMGLRTIPSAANFLMIDLRREVPPVRAALREKKVDVGRLFPALPNHLRVTVGTGEQMERFLAAFKQVMA
ncbi:MAG TPA: aminotransferase class I/II-fold pyridoxal phosphate-dependent enzyme [Thermoanaerobaculia bacterium]|nr:aminotransferase class I/II-fold pyridoxal phosphate-dependent enzyme [Thermoanaerobaculia bacterium]